MNETKKKRVKQEKNNKEALIPRTRSLCVFLTDSASHSQSLWTLCSVLSFIFCFFKKFIWCQNPGPMMSIPFLFPFFIQSLLSRVHKEPGLNGRPKDFILLTRFLSLSDRNECSNFIHWVPFFETGFHYVALALTR